MKKIIAQFLHFKYHYLRIVIFDLFNRRFLSLNKANATIRKYGYLKYRKTTTPDGCLHIPLMY